MGSSAEGTCKSSVEMFYTLQTNSGGKYRFRVAREFAFSQTPPGLSVDALQRAVEAELPELEEKIQQEQPGEGDSFTLQVVYKDNFEHGRKEWNMGPYVCEIVNNIYNYKKIERMVVAAMSKVAESIRYARFFTAEEDIYRNSALEKGKEDRNEQLPG